MKVLIFENTEENLMNKEAFLVLIVQLLQPLDKLYKMLRNCILMNTKGLTDLTVSHRWMIYHSIILSKNLFTLFQSQNDLERKAEKEDKLIPPIKSNLRYDSLVFLNEAFVNEIISIPRVGSFMYVMLKKENFDNDDDENEAKCYKQMLGQIDDLNFKNLFNSFYFSKESRITDENPYEEEKIETKSESEGNLLAESMKSEKKMFIFANIFVLLNKYFIKVEHNSIPSALIVLDKTVIHLPAKLFSEEENYLDSNFNMFLLKNQLNYLVDSSTVRKLFSLVLPQDNVSESDMDSGSYKETNPSSVMSLCKIYAMLMMLSLKSPSLMLNEKHLNFSDIISIGLAFKPDLLYSLWNFINLYFDPENYSHKEESNKKEYNMYAYLICIFSQSIIRNLWISSIEDFNRETKFSKHDVIRIVAVLKQFVVDTILSERIRFELDKFILMTCSSLLRLLFDMFINELEDDDMEDDLFHIKDIAWETITEEDHLSENIVELIHTIPE